MFRTILLAIDGSKYSEKAAGFWARTEFRSSQYGGIARILTNLADDLDAA